MSKYIPTTTTTKKRGPKPKKPRSIIESCVEAVSEPKKPFVMKLTFNPKPTWRMTDEEVYAFARRQALDASDTIRTNEGRMTQDEMQQYAAAIYDSIIWFNRKDRRHAEHMRYLAELKKKEEMRERDAQDGKLKAKIHAATKE